MCKYPHTIQWPINTILILESLEPPSPSRGCSVHTSRSKAVSLPGVNELRALERLTGSSTASWQNQMIRQGTGGVFPKMAYTICCVLSAVLSTLEHVPLWYDKGTHCLALKANHWPEKRGAHVSKHIYQLHLHLHLPFECQIISVHTNLSMNLYTHTISMEPALSLIHYLDRFRASSKPGSQQNREFDKTFTQRDIFGWRQPICSPVSGHVAPEAGSAAAWCRTPRPSCSGGEIKRLNQW